MGFGAVKVRVVERVQSIGVGATHEVPSLGVLETTLPPFEELARAAKERDEDVARLRVAVELCPPTLRGAEALIALLESGLLDGLSFERGLPAREAVIEKVLTLDVHALRIPPEQLAWLRGLQRRRRLTGWLAGFGALASVGFAIAEWFFLTS